MTEFGDQRLPRLGDEPKRTASIDVISHDIAGTVPGLFRNRVARMPDKRAYRQYDAAQDRWLRYGWRETEGLVTQWRAALAGEGLEPGERVAIALPNGVAWVCFDIAALSLGLVTVPLYVADTPENQAYFLSDSGARLLVIDTHESWARIAACQEPRLELDRIVVLSGAHGETGPAGPARLLADWLPSEPAPPLADISDADALATIVYTSGTTGRPKGVMLSHRNLLWAAEAVLDRVPAYSDDVFMSFLPLAHSFERTVGYYLPMMAGCEIGYARSIKTLAEDLLIVRPTVLLSVPRIYERVYGEMWRRAERHWLSRKLLTWTERAGWRRHEWAQGRAPRPPWIHRLAWPVLRKLVTDKLLGRFGGRVRVAVSGGAPLSAKVARFFVGVGFPLIEGYGLAEAASPACGNALGNNLVGSVGTPLRGIAVDVATSDRELLVRAPSVMLGYWNRPEATAKAIDDDGWLHTGDVGEISEGRVFIRGRIKEILVTSTGEKVPPADLENAITLDPLFDQAAVVGEGKPFLVALLVVNPDRWREFAASHGLDPDAEDSLRAAVAIEAALAKLRHLLRGFPKYAQIQAVHLSLEPWTIENRLLTVTMKLKRYLLEDRSRAEIDALYRGHVLPK